MSSPTKVANPQKKSRAVMVRLTPKEHDSLKAHAAQQRRKVAQMAAVAVAEWLTEHGK